MKSIGEVARRLAAERVSARGGRFDPQAAAQDADDLQRLAEVAFASPMAARREADLAVLMAAAAPPRIAGEDPGVRRPADRLPRAAPPARPLVGVWRAILTALADGGPLSCSEIALRCPAHAHTTVSGTLREMVVGGVMRIAERATGHGLLPRYEITARGRAALEAGEVRL
jgi:hypothetical protein